MAKYRTSSGFNRSARWVILPAYSSKLTDYPCQSHPADPAALHSEVKGQDRVAGGPWLEDPGRRTHLPSSFCCWRSKLKPNCVGMGVAVGVGQIERDLPAAFL